MIASTVGCACSSDSSNEPRRRIAPAAATFWASGASPSLAESESGRAWASDGWCSPMRLPSLFRIAAFLAKLYSEAIVEPTVEVTVATGKGGLDGESGRRFEGDRRLSHREPRRRHPATHARSAVAA